MLLFKLSAVTTVGVHNNHYYTEVLHYTVQCALLWTPNGESHCQVFILAVIHCIKCLFALVVRLPQVQNKTARAVYAATDSIMRISTDW
jgi:hypothetical protein